jgi:hypothetical protein
LTELIADHWPILAYGGVVVLAAGAVLILIRWRKGWVSAVLALLVSALAGALLTGLLLVLSPTLYNWLVQEDRIDPRNQVGIALLPIGSGPILARRLVEGSEQIQSIDVDEQEASAFPRGDTMRDSAWSPDGEAVAYAQAVNGASHIFRVTLEAGEPVALTQGQVMDREPVWSPGGERIAFVRGAEGNGDIYVVDADGVNVGPVTSDAADDSSPSWSADGAEIAFARRTATGSDIYVVHVRTRAVSKLIDHPSSDEDPAWSPDGSEIAFATDRDGDFEIYRFVVGYQGGSATVRRTKNGLDDRFPAWSPDGGEIAYLQRDDDAVSLRVMNRRTRRQDREIVHSLVPARLSWRPVPKQGWDFRAGGDLRYRYAPVAYLHGTESYWPLSASTFISRSRLLCGKRVLAQAADELLLGRPDLAYAGRPPLSAADERRFRCDGTRRLDVEDGRRRGRRPASDEGFYGGAPSYSERNEYPGGMAITYWLYYAYSVAGGKFGPHEADWERITICFTTDESGQRHEPVRIVYHQHNGTEVRPWRWAPKLVSHPVVYVAKGSHATYANAGRRANTQDLTDEGRIWPTWWALLSLRDQPWYNFRGSWGGPAGPSTEKGGGRECVPD